MERTAGPSKSPLQAGFPFHGTAQATSRSPKRHGDEGLVAVAAILGRGKGHGDKGFVAVAFDEQQHRFAA